MVSDDGGGAGGVGSGGDHEGVDRLDGVALSLLDAEGHTCSHLLTRAKDVVRVCDGARVHSMRHVTRGLRVTQHGLMVIRDCALQDGCGS